jgi:outer membrane receptor protein involved in Fe transport
MTPKLPSTRSARSRYGIAMWLLAFVLCGTNAFGQDQEGSREGAEAGGAVSDDVWAGVEEMVVSGSTAGGILADVARSNSVTAFSAEDLEAIGAADISDIANFTPNLEIVVAGSTSPTFFIRGIGLNDFNANAAGAVAVYTDDVPLNSPALQLGSLYDIEGANVLRGPQGTGPFRNASAGAIKVYSRKPTGDFGVTFSAELGNYNSRDFQGSLEFPVTDETIWARLSFRSSERDGTYRNRCVGAPAVKDRETQRGGVGAPNVAYCGETVAINRQSTVDPNQPTWINSRNNWSARGVFLIQPDISGDVDVDSLFTVRGGRRDEPSFVGQSIGTTGENRFIDPTITNPIQLIDPQRRFDLKPPIQGIFGGPDQGGFQDPDIAKAIDNSRAALDAACAPCTAAEFTANQFEAKRRVAQDLARELDSHPFVGSLSHTGGTVNETFGVSLKNTIEVGELMEITTVSGFDMWDRRVDIDLDFSPNPLFEIDTKDNGYQLFQELRFNGQAFHGLDEIFGGPLDWEVGAFVLYEDLHADVQNFFGSNDTLTGAPRSRNYDQDLLSLAGYAALSWDFWEVFTLDGGVRFNYEKRQIYYVLGLNGPDLIDDNKLVGQEPTGTIRLTWRPTEESSVYMKYTHGWKSGTFNATGSRRLGVQPAGPEKIDAFEAGLRGSYFENRLNLNLAAFHYTYEDYQLFTSFTAFQAPPQFVILNASDVEIYGAEVEATILPWEGGLFDVKFAWLEGEFLDFVQTQLKSRALAPLVTIIIPVETDFSGNRLLNAPRYTVTLTAQQAFPIGRFGTIVARWDGTWKDDTFFDASEGKGLPNENLQTFLPDNTIGQEAYWIHNLRLSYVSPNETVEVAAWVRNLEDKTYKAFAADLTPFQRTTLFFVGDPRTFGVTTTVRF